MGGSREVVVAGLGVMGAAVVRELARRGVRVLALDPHEPPHDRGSSHGETRIIREAYFEHPLYVPLVRRAFDAWGRLENEAGEALLKPTGVLSVGPPDGHLVPGALASSREHGVPHDILDRSEVRVRYPHLDLPASAGALLEPRGGVLRAERSVAALVRQAEEAGAEIRVGEPIAGWRRTPKGLVARTGSGEVACGRIILCTGAWTRGLLEAHALAAPTGMMVERQVVAFFDLPAAATEPVVLWEYEPGRFFYTLPDASGGLKAGIHHEGEAVDPDTVDRTVRDEDLSRIRALLDRLMPDVPVSFRAASVCLYTNMPDSNFLIDTHPLERDIVVLSACSGHGFKFAPALAPIVADLALGHPPNPEAAPFQWREPDTA